MKIFFLFFLFFLSGCSLKTPQNEWQYKTSNTYALFIKYFLSNDDALAKNEFTRALNHAKKGSDIKNLAKIHLSQCALNISVGVKEDCPKYKEIEEIFKDKELEAYHAFITSSITDEQKMHLDKKYRVFDLQTIFSLEDATSIYLFCALNRDKLDAKSIEELIKISSFNGHKKITLFWLNEKKRFAKTDDEIKKIEKQLSILTAP
jgi:hypothetical protein